MMTTTLGLRPHLAPHALLQVLNRLCAFLILTTTCSLHVNRESRITPRYLADLERLGVTPNKCGSKKPGSFLFLVIATSYFLSGLTDSPTSLHHVCAVRRAHCLSPDTVFGNLPNARIHTCHLRALEYISHFH